MNIRTNRRVRRHHSSRLRIALAALGAIVMVATGYGFTPPPPAAAADASQFNPELIISDQLFYDGAAMTAGQIQSFLDSKIGRCSNGRCLNVAVLPVTSRPRDVSRATGNVICEAITGGNLRVSELIYRTQAACKISAKVILATLQKEQSLVTDNSPGDWQLKAAMGQGCPDTAPCSEAFAGLANQIISGTAQLHTYKADQFARQPGVHHIGYSPNSSCGGTYLNIRNYATAALYNYTPYQPNAVALRNLYGTGDGCSSYGNRNFWRLYTDWFGPTTLPPTMAGTTEANYLLGIDGSAHLWGYPATGTERWMARASMGPGWQGIRQLVGAGDFNRNGYRDVIGIDTSGSAWFYPGNGELEYPSRARLSVDWSQQRVVAYAGDFNGDGVPDVMSIDLNGVLWLWPGAGDGTFAPPAELNPDWGSIDYILGVGDFNADGAADLVAREKNGDLYLYRGNGRGGWKHSLLIGTGWNGIKDIYTLGDFTGDAIPDLLARFPDGTLRLYYGLGDGRVTGGTQVDAGWNALKVVSGPGDPPGLSATAGKDAVGQPGAGDIDGTGQRNILGIRSDGTLGVYSRGRSGLVGPRWLNTSFAPGEKPITLGDFKGDGSPDLGLVTSDGTLWLIAGDGKGDYAPRIAIGNGWNGYTIIGGLDFDGDGNQDILARDSDGQLWLYRGDGRGGFPDSRRLVGSGWGPFDTIFAAGDFDGSGGHDVIARAANGDLWLYPTNGRGAWKSAKLIGTGWDAFDTVFSPGEFNDLAGTDIIARTRGGQLYLYSGNYALGMGPGKLIDSGWHTMSWIG